MIMGRVHVFVGVLALLSVSSHGCIFKYGTSPDTLVSGCNARLYRYARRCPYVSDSRRRPAARFILPAG